MHPHANTLIYVLLMGREPHPYVARRVRAAAPVARAKAQHEANSVALRNGCRMRIARAARLALGSGVLI